MPKVMFAAGLAACLVPLGASAAIAQDYNSRTMMVTGEHRGYSRSMQVAIGDLDLRQDRAVSRAQSRIRHASKIVCDVGMTDELYEKRDYRACFVPTLASARSELDRHVALARAG